MFRPYNKFLNSPPSRQRARLILSKLKSTERVYVWLANGKVRRIDGNGHKVWLDFRLNYEGAHMMHNHPRNCYAPDFSGYDIWEADDLRLAATEMIWRDRVLVYRPGFTVEAHDLETMI